jgi:hypothetical protein
MKEKKQSKVCKDCPSWNMIKRIQELEEEIKKLKGKK